MLIFWVSFKRFGVISKFSYQNFRNHQFYKKTLSTSNQPTWLHATAKTHKFEDLDDISVDKLKFRPTIGQTSIFTYNAAKVIGEQGFFQTFFTTVIRW